jgi:MerR family transcriptional regulator, light-induced transcriptional regulator
MPPGLTIGQVSDLLGVPVPTLRSWERRYLVAVPERTEGGHRRYGPEQVEALQALNAAVARGIAPGTAAQSLRSPQPDPAVPLSLLSSFLDAVHARDQSAICDVLDAAADALGLEPAVDRLVVPALREVGRRWEVGLLDVGAEHLATAATRQWIGQRTVGLPRSGGGAPVILAAGPGNLHTVALEAFVLLLDHRGWPTCMLGADTPAQAMLSTSRSIDAAAAVVTAQQVSRSRLTVALLRMLADRTRMQLFYAGAAFDNPRARRTLPGTYLGTSLPEAADAVEAVVFGQPAGG